MPSAEALWTLRPDLEIMEAEADDGMPAVLVHDPLTGDFDRVEWPESDLVRLLRRPRTLPELHAAFGRIGPLRPTLEDVGLYLVELGRKGWLRGDGFWPLGFRERPRRGLVGRLAGLLFIQVPLLKPEALLRATAPLARLVFNPFALGVFVLAGLAGLYLALPRWEDYWRDSLGGFDLRRMPAFMAALILVKVAHEFSHAFVATLSGARVSSMGVAFFFFMPLPFTDVTDAWRLPWGKRLRVASAGMAAETALAGAALLLWALSPPGDAAVALARLSSVALASTLLTNLNPGPRFDGYYVLTCLLRTENLRSRAMADLRRILWGALLGIRLPDAEAGMPGRRRWAVRIYALYAVFYRLSLGLGLALLAYYMFPKVLGVPLAAVELWLFFGHPVAAELILIKRNIRAMRPTLGCLFFLAAVACLGVWFVGEWPHRLRFPAVTRAAVEEAVRTQRSGVLLTVAGIRGEAVAAGQRLAELGAPADEPLFRRARWALTEAELAEEQSWSGTARRRDAGRRAAETRRRRVELDALLQRSDYLVVQTPSGGSLAAWDESAAPGVSVPRGKVLGWVVDGPVNSLSCYSPMEQAERLAVGTEVRFFPDTGEPPIPGRIARIDETRPEILEDPQLAAALGAVPRGGAYALPTPYVRVAVTLDAEAARVGQTGTVWLWGRPESMLDRTWRWLKDLAVRESAF